MEILANSYHVGRVPRHPRCVGERLRIAGRGTIYFGLFWGDWVQHYYFGLFKGEERGGQISGGR